MSSEKRPQDAARRAAEEIVNAIWATVDPRFSDNLKAEAFVAEIVQQAIDASRPPTVRGFEEWKESAPIMLGCPPGSMQVIAARAAFEAGAASARGAGWGQAAEQVADLYSRGRLDPVREESYRILDEFLVAHGLKPLDPSIPPFDDPGYATRIERYMREREGEGGDG